MAFQVDRWRELFPSLESGIAHFDGPGGTQTPRVVGEAIAATISSPLSNRGTNVLSEQNAEDAVHAFRAAYADFLNAEPSGIVYGRSATQLCYDFSRHLAKNWGPGDEVVVTNLDHDSNVRPWIQAAERVGATVRVIPIDPQTGELDLRVLDTIINEKTVLVAVGAASNLLGTRPPVRRIADAAHAVGALVYVDGVHLSAHDAVDIQALGADFFTCSPYKFFGPHCAVLAADPALLETITPDKLLPSTNQVPERFEFGTLPYEIMAGATAAVDVIANAAFMDERHSGLSRRERLEQSFEAFHEHEMRLRDRIETALLEWDEHVRLHSRAQHRTPTLFFTLRDGESAQLSKHLAERLIQAPTGDFYAYEVFRSLGVPGTGGVRVGLAPYNTDDDVDRLLNGIADFFTDL